MQQILLFRELAFSLKEIRTILSDPHFDRAKALEQQIALLTMKKERLESILTLAQNIRSGGIEQMNFSAFDTQKIDEYAKRAKEQWGDTQAYREFSQKSADEDRADEETIARALMDIFCDFGKIKDTDPASLQAQALVKRLQDYISTHYYQCTVPILKTLGAMYTGDGEFKQNIDLAGGDGTADFAAAAIDEYCK